MRAFIIVMASLLPCIGFAQMRIPFHQSNLLFAGISYEIKNRLRPELRVGTDNYFDDLSIEGTVTYDPLEREEYEIYAGLGVRTNGFTGLGIPVDLNVYPFPTNKLGFPIELAPIISDNGLLRDSWGIRYRFSKKQEL
jgi:hypothetical protein